MDLRPLRFPEVLDAAFRLYRSRFLACITRSAIVLGPIWLMLSLLEVALIARAGVDAADETLLALFGIPVSVIGTFMVACECVALVFVTVWCAGRLGQAALGTPAPRDRERLRVPPRSNATRVAIAATLLFLFLGMLATSALAAKATEQIPAILILLFPAIWLAFLVPYVFLFVAAPAAVLERISFPKALARSARLITGRFWATLMMCMSAYLIIIVVVTSAWPLELLLLSAGELGGDRVLALIVLTTATIAATFLLPFVSALSVVWYYDIRVRREGLDLVLAARRVGRARSNEAAA